MPANRASPRETLAAVVKDLREMNQSTERDFLRVGERLQSFLTKTEDIRGRCEALIGVLSGESASQADGDLHSILARFEALAGDSGRGSVALHGILAGIGEVAAPLLDLNRDMRMFRVFATLIRIESARLQGDGMDFGAQADEVRKLAADIERSSEPLLAAAAELGALVRKSMPGIDEFERRQGLQVPAIRGRAEASLRELAAGRQRAVQGTRQLAAESDSIRRQIGELVTSLQYHDIARQQIEHAAAALEDAQAAEQSAVVARICDLQRAQLEQSKTTFVATVGRVRDSLEEIAAHVAGMDKQTGDLLGGVARNSFMGELEQGFSGIRTALLEHFRSTHALAGVVTTVADGVERMSGFVETIEGIDIRMQRIALNANLKAIQIGEKGIALGAVADRIQVLAEHSAGNTGMAAAKIWEVAGGAAEIAQEMAASGQDSSGGLEQTIASFRAADAASEQRLAEVGELSRSLAAELAALRDSIRADVLLAGTVERTDERLAALAATVPVEALRGEALSQDRYTMHAERMVHEQVAGGTTVTVAAAGAGDFGNNVELF